MYEKFFSDFKSQLTDRCLSVRVLMFSGISLICCLSCLLVLWTRYKIIWLYWFALFMTVIISIIVAYTTIFFTVRKKLNLKGKVYFRGIRTIKKLRTIQQADVSIMLPLLRKAKIDTAPKVQEAIRHFQMILHNKRGGGIAIASVISILLTVIGSVFPVVTLENSKQFMFVFITLLFIVLVIATGCFAFNCFYKAIY